MTAIPCKPWDGRHRPEDGRPMLGKRYAYRVLWEEQHGPVPEGLVLHHTCEHGWCVETAHLEPQPRAKHLLEHHGAKIAAQIARTHCPSGHEYAGANLRTRPNGKRSCVTCDRASSARARAKRRSAGR